MLQLLLGLSHLDQKTQKHHYYDKTLGKWCENPNGTYNGALYIGTEMELLEEIDPILWAYIADVPQDHIEFNF